ncbi:hypothetical protein [uncultured Catenibacterium sp.]|uniref:hypothetical protein n=1 Tax=uncultured Catenibacterium sp. TaxID=286142 RepID=UPI0025CE90D0|nr:hypothetical protein [uncultured Catenibacterium sp.]
MLNAERFKEEINKHNNEFGLTDSIADCKTLECRNCRFSRLNNSDDEIILCSTRKTKWLLSEYKEPVKLTRLEYEILEHLLKYTEYVYMTREKDGALFVYDDKPCKTKYYWNSSNTSDARDFEYFNDLFQFIKWEDSEPTSINGVLENCEVVEDDQS